jgi:hypothetical protein
MRQCVIRFRGYDNRYLYLLSPEDFFRLIFFALFPGRGTSTGGFERLSAGHGVAMLMPLLLAEHERSA